MIKISGYFYIFLQSTKINARPQRVNSLVDGMSTNATSTISKTVIRQYINICSDNPTLVEADL